MITIITIYPRLAHLECRERQDLVRDEGRQRVVDPVRVGVDLEPAAVLTEEIGTPDPN